MELLKRAVDLGDGFAVINLAKAHLNPDYYDEASARGLFEKAVEMNAPECYYNLGKFLITKGKDVKEGIRLLKLGIKQQEPESAHYLAHYYQSKKAYDKAEKMFLEAFHLGRRSALLCLSECAFELRRHDRRKFIIGVFQENLIDKQIIGPTILLEYSRLLLWDDQYSAAMEYLTLAQPLIDDAFNDNDEEFKQHLISELTEYFVLLLAKKQFTLAKDIFNNEAVNYKQILKPVYYALMNFMKSEYPSEYLKAGAELQETIEEIIDEVGKIAAVNVTAAN